MNSKETQNTHWHVVRDRPNGDDIEILCRLKDPEHNENRCIAFTRGDAYRQARAIPKSPPDAWPQYKKPYHTKCQHHRCRPGNTSPVLVFTQINRMEFIHMAAGNAP